MVLRLHHNFQAGMAGLGLDATKMSCRAIMTRHHSERRAGAVDRKALPCPPNSSPPFFHHHASPGTRAESSARNDRRSRSTCGPFEFGSRWPVISGLSRCSTWPSTALVRLQVRDVFAAGQVVERASVIQKKTGRPVRFEITETTRICLKQWIAPPGRHAMRQARRALRRSRPMPVPAAPAVQHQPQSGPRTLSSAPEDARRTASPAPASHG